eukprot:COSAG06_NODE_56370_length_285_cov_0.666667_1_plen_41_part_10
MAVTDRSLPLRLPLPVALSAAEMEALAEELELTAHLMNLVS